VEETGEGQTSACRYGLVDSNELGVRGARFQDAHGRSGPPNDRQNYGV